MLLPLGVKTQYCSENSANFKQILPNLLKFSNKEIWEAHISSVETEIQDL